jgi:hypothetical protein
MRHYLAMTSTPPPDTEPPPSADDTLVDIKPWHDFAPDALDELLYRALVVEEDS